MPTNKIRLQCALSGGFFFSARLFSLFNYVLQTVSLRNLPRRMQMQQPIKAVQTNKVNIGAEMWSHAKEPPDVEGAAVETFEHRNVTISTYLTLKNMMEKRLGMFA